MSSNSTELAFHASSQVPEQETVTLGSFVTACYERVRVLAVGPSGSPGEFGEVELTLSLEQEQGTPGPLDRVLIGSNSTFTRVYEVPGLMLGVIARAPSAASHLDVYIWGSGPAGEGMVLVPDQTSPEPEPEPEPASPDTLA